MPKSMQTCREQGCDQPVHARGRCSRHYQQYRKWEKTYAGVKDKPVWQPDSTPVGRPADKYITHVRKALRGDQNAQSKVQKGGGGVAPSREIIMLRRWEDELASETAKKSRRGRLGNQSPSNTATTLHTAKPAKNATSTPPAPQKAQNFDHCRGVYNRPLDERDQGRHKYGGGAMLMGHVPERCRRETGPRASIGGVWVRTTPRTSVVLEPLSLPSRTDFQARYEGTKRLHALGWWPPSANSVDDEWAESVVVLEELTA